MTKIAIDGRLMVGLAVTAQLGKLADTTTDQAHASFSRVAVVPAISNVTSSPPMIFDTRMTERLKSVEAESRDQPGEYAAACRAEI